jgi:hypothetical protein
MLQQHDAQPGDDHEDSKTGRLDQVFRPVAKQRADNRSSLCPVIPAKAGIQNRQDRAIRPWAPASAGVTVMLRHIVSPRTRIPGRGSCRHRQTT